MEHDNSDIIIRRKNVSNHRSKERTVPVTEINRDYLTSDSSSSSEDFMNWN